MSDIQLKKYQLNSLASNGFDDLDCQKICQVKNCIEDAGKILVDNMTHEAYYYCHLHYQQLKKTIGY